MKEAKKKIQGEKSLSEAIKLLKEGKKRKFVESINIDILLNLKEKQKKESLKGSVSLPVKFGEDKKVIVFCDEKDVAAAKKAGAIDAGLEDLEKKVMDGWSGFDVVIATPAVMPKIAKLGKVLGPKGLMPNPRNGTISDNIEEAIKSFVAGKMNYQMEAGHGVVKAKVALIDMEEEKISQNVLAFVGSVLKEAKKFGANPFKRIVLASTMGSGIKLSISDIITNVK